MPDEWAITVLSKLRELLSTVAQASRQRFSSLCRRLPRCSQRIAGDGQANPGQPMNGRGNPGPRTPVAGRPTLHEAICCGNE